MTSLLYARPDRPFDATTSQRWWASLVPDPDNKRPGNPAALAELRRCMTAHEVLMLPAFEGLMRQLPASRDPHHIESLAVVAGALAHVRKHDGADSVPRQLAQIVGEGNAPPMSPARFRRLLQVQSANERLVAGARIARQLKGQLNVLDLAYGLYWWDEPEAAIQRAWARAYYQALPSDLLSKT